MMYSEAFPSSPLRHYFFDLRQAGRGHVFLQLSCSEKQRDGSYQRNRIVVFLRDMPMVIEALTSICHHAGYLDLDGPEGSVKSEADSLHQKLCPAPLPDAGMAPVGRMKRTGAGSLTDGELVALLFSAGLTDGQSLELSQKVLAACGGLSGLAYATSGELKRIPGIGNIRSSAILATVEIARRLNASGVF